MKITVLGAGRIGGAIARDLARDGEFDVTIADLADAALARLRGVPGVTPARADVSDAEAFAGLVRDRAVVVNALPGPIGYDTLRRLLDAGRDVVDISFCEEDPFTLDALARDRGCTAVVDCGVAPGLSNLILGHVDAVFDATERFECLVGGLPVERTRPYEYKAPFSPIDVLAEYTRPARLRRDGRTVTVPALSETERVDVPGLGTLEAFNTDGLRTLLRTVDTPNMVEKTLRYPGHARKMRLLRESGFFGTRRVDAAGASVRPLDLTAELLLPAWEMDEDDEDLTAMRVTVDGTHEQRPQRWRATLLDRYDRETGTSSMARTTGYTCTAIARLVARGRYDRPGVSAPEHVGARPDCYSFVMRELTRRDIVLEESTAELD